MQKGQCNTECMYSITMQSFIFTNFYHVHSACAVIKFLAGASDESGTKLCKVKVEDKTHLPVDSEAVAGNYT